MTSPVPLLHTDCIGGPHTRGTGKLSGTIAERRVTLPLARVEIAARVAERVANVTIAETFRNAEKEPIEAVYVFPLPGGAAVSEFELRVGARVVRGRVEERGAAREQYKEALESGKRAALLEQERDDVFTMQVGNIPPGEDVCVRVTYSETLPFLEDGATEIRLPLVVAPRYIPGLPLERPPTGDGVGTDTDVVPDASRISPPRLAPGFDPNVALAIEVEIVRASKGAPDIEDLACSQHATHLSSGALGVKVTLARQDEALDRDFVLRWRLASAGLRSSLLVHKGTDGVFHGLISIVPPRRDGYLGLARDVVFVLDRSGSMKGAKMAHAARACGILIQTLSPRDRFTILAFDNVVESLGEKLVAADEAGIASGERWLRGIDARGGTEIDGALERAIETLRSRGDPEPQRAPVIVFLTDGQVTDEPRVLRRIQRDLGFARVFAVGIDTAVNEGFLKRLAALGGGTAAFVEPGAAAVEDALRAIAREIGAPLAVDLEIEDEGAGLEKGSLAPTRVPDLFAGRAAQVFFRMKRPGRVRLTGRASNGSRLEESVEAREVALPAIAQLWAKARVTDLEDRFRAASSREPEKLKLEIVDLAKRYTLLTRLTAFVAVDESEVIADAASRRKIIQPVANPSQWSIGGAAFESSLASCVAPARPAPVGSGGILSKIAGAFGGMGGAGGPGARGGGGGGAARPMSGGTKICPNGHVMDATWDRCPYCPDPRAGRAQRAPVPPTRVGGMPPPMAAAMPAPTPGTMVGGPTLCGAGMTLGAQEVTAAIQALADAIAAADAELRAGRTPPREPFEAARRRLRDALSTAEVAPKLPLLQRFLRGSAAELSGALVAKGVAREVLRSLIDRARRELDEARAEAAPHLGTTDAEAKAAARTGPFWEAMI